MFTLEDGRNELFQWDLNRRVIVDNDFIEEVHFCNKTSDCSLIVKTYRIDGGVLVADIPNVLLQTDFPIRVYAYSVSQYTAHEATLKVKARTKPSDYVYTETEIKRYEDLEERLEALNNLIENLDIPETDLPYVYTIRIENDSLANDLTELRTLYNKVMAGERVLCYWSCPEGVCHTRIRINTSTSIVMVNPSHAYVQDNEIKLISGQLNIQANGTVIYAKSLNSETAPTKSKVEAMITSALSGIATAEGGAY